MSEIITAEQVKESIKKKGITRVPVHDCSICGYPCGYVIDHTNVYYDSGCECTGTKTHRLSSHEDIAECVNRQTKLKPIVKLLDAIGIDTTGVQKC